MTGQGSDRKAHAGQIRGMSFYTVQGLWRHGGDPGSRLGNPPDVHATDDPRAEEAGRPLAGTQQRLGHQPVFRQGRLMSMR